MLGQHGHFALYAQEKIPYAIERYRDEAARLYRRARYPTGQDRRLRRRRDYSIADIACFPWTMTHKAQGFTLDDYPNIKRWYAEVRARPQVQAGLAIGKFVKKPFDEEARKNMFGQTAKEMAGEELKLVIPGRAQARSGIHATRAELDHAILRGRASRRHLRNDGVNEQNKQKGNAMIEFFFDCSSPWTYLAFHNIQPLAKEFGVEISWRPILVGGIFNTHQSQRLCLARDAGAGEGALHEEGHGGLGALGRACDQDAADGVSGEQRQGDARLHLAARRRWCRSRARCSRPIGASDKDISQDAVLTEICKRVGVDPQKFFAGIGEQAIKDQLKANTDEVMARGGFGSPTIFLDKTDMYFGNDRLPLIREALQRAQERARPDAEEPSSAANSARPRACGWKRLPPRRWRRAQVRVAIHAAGINFPDILMAAGEYQLKPPLPFTPGVEAAGDVIEVNDAARASRSATRSSSRLRHGAYADEAVVTPSQLTPLPSTFDYAEGATFLAGHGTAYHALIDRGQLQPGEVLLVHGAGGGVGLAAVEIGKMLGATVIAAASSRRKACGRARRRAPIISCSTAASRFATPSSASPTAAARTWCSIPSAARCSRTACAASPGARGCW